MKRGGQGDGPEPGQCGENLVDGAGLWNTQQRLEGQAGTGKRLGLCITRHSEHSHMLSQVILRSHLFDGSRSPSFCRWEPDTGPLYTLAPVTQLVRAPRTHRLDLEVMPLIIMFNHLTSLKAKKYIEQILLLK